MVTPGADDRDLDLVLLGATGYVGRLTAAHLARSAPARARIALAGRSGDRLRALRDDLGPSAASWELRTTDVTERPALDRLAAQTRVLVTTVGPYARWGLPVVAACAERGTHYADLSGETLFVRDSIAASHGTAQESGARVVHSCGFDSVPSDLGVRLVAEQVEADGEGTPGETALHVRDMRGGLSGGTVDSLRQQLIAVEGRPDVRRLLTDPDALTGGTPPRRESRGHATLTRDGRSGIWSAPFVMSPYNRQIVMRTDALLGAAYGPAFDYREVVDTTRGPLGAAAAAVVAGAQGVLVGSLASRTTRLVADRVLPAPGAGPSEAARRRGRFAVEVVTTTTTGARYSATIAAAYDPGYEGTAVLLGESALALALDELPDAAGVLTPMTGIGLGLAHRLRAHGFEVGVRRLT
ncbi:MAG: saccharopine dehydrogenase family protein [Janthinobacterium lividum]